MVEQIKQLLKEITNNSIDIMKLSNDADIINDVGLDSIQMINFILTVEERFDINIDFEKFNYEHMGSINKLCQFISDSKTDVVSKIV